jgi:hypothetical protein
MCRLNETNNNENNRQADGQFHDEKWIKLLEHDSLFGSGTGATLQGVQGMGMISEFSRYNRYEPYNRSQSRFEIPGAAYGVEFPTPSITLVLYDDLP